MIGKLKGIIDEINKNYLLLNVKDVYYKLFIPNILLKSLKIGDTQTFDIHFHVRENEISLYGFSDKKYLRIFNILISISSIGPKSALNIIGYDSLDKLLSAVQNQNAAYFAKIPGIGKKTSQKILLELSNKFEIEFKPKDTTISDQDKLVVEALTTLGFTKAEAYTAVPKLNKDDTLEQKITDAIKNLNTNEN